VRRARVQNNAFVPAPVDVSAAPESAFRALTSAPERSTAGVVEGRLGVPLRGNDRKRGQVTVTAPHSFPKGPQNGPHGRVRHSTNRQRHARSGRCSTLARAVPRRRARALRACRQWPCRAPSSRAGTGGRFRASSARGGPSAPGPWLPRDRRRPDPADRSAALGSPISPDGRPVDARSRDPGEGFRRGKRDGTRGAGRAQAMAGDSRAQAGGE